MGIGTRIKEKRKEARLSQARLADMLNVSQPTVWEWEHGESVPTRQNIPRIAKALNVSPEFLEFGKNTIIDLPDSLDTIVVRGEVRAGAYRSAMEWDSNEMYAIQIPRDERYQQLQRFALKISGPSMNLEFPDGSIVVCVKMIDLGRNPKEGEFVVVQRFDETGNMEATVKQYRQDEDGTVWLWPRSTLPEHQQPIKVEDDGNDVHIHALVIGAYRSL